MNTFRTAAKALKYGRAIKLTSFLAIAIIIAAAGILFMECNKRPIDSEKIPVNTSEDKEEEELKNVNAKPDTVRIILLHHSTGRYVWNGGVPALLKEYNKKNGTNYKIDEQDYPNTKGGYPWNNYPYDYYNLWVKHRGDSQDRKELNLDQIAKNYDVIVFKHCFPVSAIEEDTGKPDIESERKSLENYKLQYNAIKERLLEFPDKKFIVWTGASLAEDCTTPEQAKRAKEWASWVKNEWDTPNDNIFVWDFEQLETEGELYFKYPIGKADSHPSKEFCKAAAPDLVKRIVDVIEGRGDK